MTPAQDADYQSLQRTIAQLQVENERLKNALVERGQRIDRLRLDEDRLNWLETATSRQRGLLAYIEVTREQIDAAMAKETLPV